MKKPYQIEAQRAVVTRRNNLPLRVKFLSGWFLAPAPDLRSIITSMTALAGNAR